ncbi:unnamed protein product [Lathyrus sativus]|nr:unnamed protein product [Lathyrus sativus]
MHFQEMLISLLQEMPQSQVVVLDMPQSSFGMLSKKRGLTGLENEVHKCIFKERYLLNQLRGAGIGAMLNEYSNIVVFERPLDDNFTGRWNLASNKNIAHVVVLKHVTTEMLDTFIREFVQKRYVWYKGGPVQPPCIANDVGSKNCACSIHKLSRKY